MDSDECHLAVTFAVQNRRPDASHATTERRDDIKYLQEQYPSNTNEWVSLGNTGSVAPEISCHVSKRGTLDTVSHPSTKIIEGTIFQHALKVIRSSLPQHWICTPFEKGFSVMLLSRSNVKAVQRQVTVYLDGKVELFVHCKLLPSCKARQFIPDKNFDMTLMSSDNVEVVSEWVVNIVNRVRLMEICTGVTAEEFKSFWSFDLHGYVDSNPYQESRYLVAYRSHDCVMLILPRQWKCKQCSKVQEIFRKRSKINVRGIGPHTSNMYLTEEEKLRKLKDMQIQLKRMKSKVSWLKKKMGSLVEACGIEKELDDFLLNIALSNVSQGIH